MGTDKLNKLLELNLEIEGLLLIISNRGDETPAHVWEMLNEKSHASQMLIDEMRPLVVPEPIVSAETHEQQHIVTQSEEEQSEADNEEKEEDKTSIDGESLLSIDESLPQDGSRDLRKAFTLNDKFRFKRELFGNSESDFADALNIVSAMNSLSEAMEYFYDDLGWDSENEEVKDFILIISNHFNSK